MHNLLFCAHTLCMNYVTNTFLFFSSSVRSNQLLCFVHGQDQKREQKHTTKKFVGFHNHSSPLTMVLMYRKWSILPTHVRHVIKLTSIPPKAFVNSGKALFVSADVTVAVNMVMTIKPTRIHNMLNRRPMNDRGALSPYLHGSNTSYEAF